MGGKQKHGMDGSLCRAETPPEQEQEGAKSWCHLAGIQSWVLLLSLSLCCSLRNASGSLRVHFQFVWTVQGHSPSRNKLFPCGWGSCSLLWGRSVVWPVELPPRAPRNGGCVWLFLWRPFLGSKVISCYPARLSWPLLQLSWDSGATLSFLGMGLSTLGPSAPSESWGGSAVDVLRLSKGCCVLQGQFMVQCCGHGPCARLSSWQAQLLPGPCLLSRKPRRRTVDLCAGTQTLG